MTPTVPETERLDVIVIGSGPSGISAARTLLEGGSSVLLVDAGDDCPVPATSGALGALRREAERSWPFFLGRDLAALDAVAESSPKLRTPRAAALGKPYLDALRIETSNFVATGALAVGGLSNFWGASASAFSGADLERFPVTAESLAPFYRAIARRIGISGVESDDLRSYHGDLPAEGDLPAPAPIRSLLDRYARRRDGLRASGFSLGRARNAVLAAAKGARQACALDDLCLWGCARGAIYSSALEIAELGRFAKFRFERNFRVGSIASADGFWRVEAEQAGQRRALESSTVLLAAGTIATTRLVLELLGWHGRPVRLLTNPVFAAGFFIPSRIGGALPGQGFAMAQLQYVLDEAASAADYAAGALYLADGLPASEFISRLSLSRPAARAVTRAMMPAMVLATCYLSSDHSDNWMTLRPDGTLLIKGGHGAAADERAALLLSRLRRALRRLGLIPVPGPAGLSMPGSDFHYAGTLPMGASGPLATTDKGELVGMPGLYIVDGAALPRLPAKPPTLTAMANAARIAAGLVRHGAAASGSSSRLAPAERAP